MIVDASLNVTLSTHKWREECLPLSLDLHTAVPLKEGGRNTSAPFLSVVVDF